MSKHTYSDQINNSYLYNNKLFYGKEDIDEITEGETTIEKRFTNIVVSKMNDKFSLRDYPLKAASLYVSALSFILENTIVP